QDPAGGGWRYSPGAAGDLSVTGFYATAFKSARLAGLTVPPVTLRKVESFLDSVQTGKMGGYGYLPGNGETHIMTAVGLLCRLYLGADPRDPALLEGVERLKSYLPGKTRSLYFEFYVTRLTHRLGGEQWDWWERPGGRGGIRATLLAAQERGDG